MTQKTFSELTTDEKFEAVRGDVRIVAGHSSQNQNDIAVMSERLHELQSEIDRLKGEVASLSGHLAMLEQKSGSVVERVSAAGMGSARIEPKF